MFKPVKTDTSMHGARYDWTVTSNLGHYYNAGWSRWYLLAVLASYKCYWTVVLQRYFLLRLISWTLRLQKHWPVLVNTEKIVRW